MQTEERLALAHGGTPAGTQPIFNKWAGKQMGLPVRWRGRTPRATALRSGIDLSSQLLNPREESVGLGDCGMILELEFDVGHELTERSADLAFPVAGEAKSAARHLLRIEHAAHTDGHALQERGEAFRRLLKNSHEAL